MNCFPTDSGKVHMGQAVDIVTGHFQHEVEVGLELVEEFALEVVLTLEVEYA